MQTNWTRPTTDDEIAYFAKKGALLGKYKTAITWLSYLWMLFAFFGIRLGIAHVLEAMTLPSWLPTLLAFLLVIVIHPFLTEDTKTYFFDKLDDDPLTDSPWYIPALFILVVFFADRWGMQYLGEKYGYVARLESTSMPDSLMNVVNAADLQAYQQEKADIEALYKEKERSTALPYTAIINDLKRKEQTENKRYSSKISEQKAKRDAALAIVAAERTLKLEAARKEYEEWLSLNKYAHNVNLKNVTQHNNKERGKQETSEALANYGSWVIAIFFVLAFVGLNYRYCQMSIRCGVRPKHTHTPLDKYGGVKGWFWITLMDIYRRQAVRLAGAIHRIGTKGTADLEDLDTSIRFGQADYNTPDPTPDGDGDGKIKRLHRHHGIPDPATPVTPETDKAVTAETPVITTIYTDRKARLQKLLQTIQVYHNKWRSPDGGASKTIHAWLEKLWAEADEILKGTPHEALGEQVERYYRVLESDKQLMSNPRPRDVQKGAVA